MIMEFDEIKKSVLNIASNKRYQWILAIALFLAILIIGINIRVQPITTGNLIDPTTGDYTPLALDPYYFLRVSETLIANDGVLPKYDKMHYPALDSGWTKEITPYSTVFIYKTMKIFIPNISLNFVNVLSPVMFFSLGLIVFFFLSLLLTKNKWISIIASFILAVIPPYLYRTLAGFSDHEAIGMLGFFLSLLFFAFGMFYLEKKNIHKIKSGLIGIFSGFATMFAIASWGGGAKFLFMILPLAFLVLWLTKKDKDHLNYILFYGLFVSGTLLFAPMFGFDMIHILKGYMLSSAGILTLFVLGYTLIETILIKIKIIPKKIKENSDISSIFFAIVFGGIFYQIFVGNFFSMLSGLVGKIIYPFGTSRVGLTVAENKQPYLSDFIGQVGKTVFYTFLAGCFIVGGKLAAGIKDKKYRLIFSGSFIFFIIGILFSRISPSSILNGEDFVSKTLFFVSFLTLAISSIYIYLKSEWGIELKWIFIAAWMIPMLLAVRSAIRVFFAIVPFIAMVVSLALSEIWKLGRENKDELIKITSVIIAIVVSILLIIASVGFYKSINLQAKAQTPSYNTDWQNAMSWVRDNTDEGSIFLHWWDYGYWVQTGGNRPSVTDGGHLNSYWDHLVGRYVLTTPYPETAKSFMKTHNVSYLLIDPTDIGKYSAYSSIGDNENISDRASYIATLISTLSETKETNNGTIRIYRGGAVLDGDLIYNIDGKKILLPKGKAGLGAIILEKQMFILGNNSRVTFKQPQGIYVYNGQQYTFPIRYLYAGGQLIDYKNGVNATVYIYPNVIDQQFDQEGAIMYLSEKTKDSLVAKLYLMNDPDNEYSELELVHSEAAYPFAFNYGGYRGPIKIYKVNLDQMNDIIAREEFTAISGDYGELDDLKFVK